MRKRGLLIVFVVLGLALVLAKLAAAAVTVTPASGGTNISADNAANAASPAWTTLGNIAIAEGANGDMPANQTDATLILSAPTNWQFNTAAGSVTFQNGRDITAASISVATSTITVTFTTDNNANRADTITISGIQVRPTDGSLALPSSGNILRTGGTATITGITAATNFGSLSMAAGAARLAITSVNGGSNPTAGAAFSVVVRKQDQFAHTINAVAATGVSLSLNTGTGTLGGTLTGTIAAGSNSTTINGVTYTKAESGVVLTATRTSGDTPLLSGNSAAFTFNPGALSNFLVEAAGGGAIGTQTAGTSFNVRITARDANNNTVTGFTGAGNTVNITSIGTLSAGSGTTAAFTNGVLASHAVTISNTGTFTITATRTSGGAETETSTPFTVNPGALNNFLVEAVGGGNIGTQTAGTSFNIRITARDANGNTVTGFTGAGNTVDINSTGTLSAGFGTTATFTNGVLASHAVTVSNTGIFTITATRTSGGAQTGTSNSFTVNPGALALFLVEHAGGGSIGPQTAGTGFNVRITARDANGNTVTGFTGTVDISSTGTLSSGSGTTAAFTAGVLASHAVTISNTGSFTITATRTSGGAQTGTSNSFTVSPGALDNFLVEASGGGSIGTQTAGSSFNVRITARDANNNTVTGFSGTVDITSTGTLSSGSGTTAAFTAGVLNSHAVTISNTGSFTVTATRTTGGAQNGTSNSFTVNAGALANLLVEAAGGGSIGTQSAGSSFNVRITARDANNNTVTGFSSTVDITSTGTLSSGSGTTVALTAGVLATHAVTVSNTGSFTITATRTSGGAQTGTSNSFTVNPGAATKLAVTVVPATAAVGATFSVTVRSQDANGNYANVSGATGVSLSPSGAGSLGGNTATISAGTNTVTLPTVTYDTAETITLTAARTSGDALATSAASSSIDVKARPTSAVSFPSGGPHNASAWAAGCAPAGFCGTATDNSGAALATVQLSIRRGTGNYWDGSGFNSAAEQFVAASLAGANWSYAFGAGGFPADGDYTIRVRATDNLGGVQSPLTSRTFTYDATTPDTNVTAQPSDPTNATGASFSFTSTEGGSTFECNLDSGGWSSCTSPKSYTGLADGSHTFQVRATDAAGNTDASPASFTWTVDTAAPNTSITAQPSDPSSSADADFSFSSSEGGSTFECRVDGGAWAACTSPKSYTGLPDSAHTFDVRATDAAGNTDATPASFTWTVDTAAPNTSITAQPSDPTNATGATFTFTSNEGGSSFECNLDAGGWTACTSPRSYTSLGDGSHTFQVRATDTAGNTDPTPASFTWTVDTAAPNTSITAQPNDPTNATGASFSFASSEGGSTFECRIDGGAWSACASPKSYSGLAEGAHSFDVRATDAPGNTDPTQASFGWTVDTTAPNTSITAQPSDPTNATGASFSFTASEGGSTFECNLDSGGWSSCTSPKSYSGLADGAHTFDVRATDAAGNTDATPASFGWTIDTTAPNTSITAQPNDPTNATGASFSFTSSEGGSSFACRIDGGGWSACSSPTSYTGLAQGAHTFDVRATDSAGNTDASPASFGWTIDTTGPSSVVGFPVSGSTYNTVGWTDPSGTASDAGGSSLDKVEISVRRTSTGLYWDGSGFAAGSENWLQASGTGTWSRAFASVNFSADDDYVVRVRAFDTAGNVETPNSFSFTYDTATPQTTIDSAPNDPSSSANASFAFSSDELGATFECRIDGGAWAACTSPQSYTGLADGAHTFDVRATDPAGNVDASPATFGWTVDTAAPNTTITAQPSDPSGAADASISFSSSEGGSTFECRLDGGAWGACTSPKSYTGLVDGSRAFDVRATDAAGNTDPTPASFTWSIDTGPPNTTITSQPGNPANSADADFVFSSSEGGSTFECRIDGGAWSACTSPKSYTGLADGAHAFEVRATDAAANTDPTPAIFGWTIDTAAPDTTITAEPSDPANSTGASFSFTSSEGGSSFECNLDAGGWNVCTSPKSYSSLGDGSHTFQVRASDAAGNTDSSPASRTWTIDTAAPNTSITAQPNDPTNATGATFTFTSNEGGSSFECNLDAGGWSACPNPKSYSGLADGAHTFGVRATDTAGNTDPTPATFTWTIDTGAPNTAITSQPGNPANSADADFGFTSTEGGSTFECRIDGGAWAPCTSPKSYTGLADGARTFDVRATDAAGNTDPTPASFGWTIDTTAPDTTITSQPNDPANSADADFAFTSTEGGSTFECRLDGGAWAACASYTGLADGPHTFDVRATDAAGNTDPSPASFTWTIDTTAPNTSITAQPNDPTNSTGPSFSFSSSEGGSTFACNLDAGGWNACSSPTSYAGLADGAHTFQVRATDAAGNTDASPASVTWTVDTVAPDTQIDNAPPSPTNSQSASFDVSAPGGAAFDCRIDGGAWGACTSPKGYTGLAEGNHTFDVRATDAAGNTDASPASRTWTIDLTAPTAALTFPAAGGSYNATGWNDPAGTASDAVGLDHVDVSLRIAGGDWWNGSDFSATSEAWQTASGAGSWTFAFAAPSFPSDGNYVLRVRAVDAAGNVGAATARSFDVDTVAPETTIDSAPATPAADADADFAFSADQAGSTFECRLDGGTWTACTSPRSYTALAEGAHTFDVRATDVGGNTDASPASHGWTIDTVPPAATMDDPGAYLRGTIALSANATDTGGTGVASVTFERSPAGTSTWSSIPASWDTTGTANGLYDLRVVATDNAGNSSSSPALTGRWVDNLKPTVSVDDPGPVTGTVTLDATANDAHSGVTSVELQFLDGTWQTLGTDPGAPYQASWDTTTLPDGPRDLRAIATDHGGNVETSATVTVVVDNTDPTVAFTTPADGGFVNAASPDPFTLDASAADAGSGVKEVEFFDGSTSLGVDSSAPYQANWPVPGSDGPATLTAVARDNAGREASVDVTFTVDRAVPDTTLGANPGDPSREPSPVFGFSSTEPGSTFECRVDASAWAACSSPYTSVPLADGPHTFEVHAIDVAGNVDQTPASWTWLLDATAPNAAMTDPGANLRGDVTLASTQSDPGASPSGIASVEYEYSAADANTWVSVGPLPWHTNAVTDGLYDVRVVVTDNAGNRTESAPVEDRRIDNSPPATALDDPGANLRATVTLKGSASDTGSGVQQVEFEYSVDGMSWSPLAGAVDSSDPYEFALDTTGLADGFYFFRTKATDVAGNTAWSAGVGPRRIDNTPPIAVLNDPGANLRGTITLTSTADDPGGSGVASVVYHYTGPETGTTSSAWTTTDVADGVYDLTVEVTDVAGNVTMSSVVSGRRVDNTAATTGHNAPSGWQSSAVTVSLSPNDGGSGVANTQYAVDGGGWNSGTSVNVSGDGVHTISFFSTDVAGNVESAQTATVSIDTTPPDPGALDPGNYLRGAVTLSANPSAGTGGADLAEVEFQRKLSSDSTWTSIGVDTTAPYSATWVTTPADDGSWDFRFIARDTATPANESITDFASKLVDNTAPTGAVTSPLSGSVVSGNVTLGVTASDANPIASVEYFVDGSSVGSSSGTPYQVSWNSASTGDGSHGISAVITDMAGNSTSTGGVGITVDNFAPTVSVSGLPANVSGAVSVSASASSDTATVAYEARLHPSGGWSSIGSSSGGSPWTIAWTPAVDGTYEVRAKATDAGGNSGTSAVVTTRVDNTDPSGLLTAPGGGATVGGTVNLAASASDSGSGVATVTWQAQSGGGGFADIASDSSAPYDATWSVGGLSSGTYDLRIVVTDLAGNSFTSAPITVDVDATAPGVSLNSPGSPVSGTISLSASTTGDATSVTFSRSPAGAATWTTIGTDGSAPYGASFNTTSVGDGLYDLRAVVTDAVGNTSQSVVGGIRVDNFIPIVISSVPSNGAIVASASQIAITASEDITSLTGVTLDGAAAAGPTISGPTATFNTGALANGTHTLAGTVRDAAGNSSAFSITFMVGVPAVPPAGGDTGGTFGSVLPLVPAPHDFRGVLESDGSLTLRWTPAQNAKGQPYATILFVDGIAKQTFAPGEDEVNLGQFDPADMRVFSIASVDDAGHASPTSQQLRSTSRLAGKTLDEATAVLRDRGFELGAVRGTGTVVSEPVVAPLGTKIGLELGQGQARFSFDVVGTKRYVPSQRKTIAIRARTSHAAVVTAELVAPRNVRIGGWRFSLQAGTTIRRLTMPLKARRPGTYRVTFSVRSGPDASRKAIVVQVVGKKPRPETRPAEVVLTGASTDIARNVGAGTKVVSAIGEDTWTIAGSQNRNVRVIVVDVDRYGLQLIKDMHTVFPSLKIVALTNDPRRLAQAVRAGAAVAVPRSTPPADVAKLIRRLTRR